MNPLTRDSLGTPRCRNEPGRCIIGDYRQMKKNLPKMEVLHNAATLAGALLVYYYFPVTGDSSPLWQVLLFAVGLGLLVWWVIRELKRQLAAGSSGVRIRSLVTLLYPLVALFALAYYLLQRSDPAQFDGLVTRTDSLYFTVITLGTIGYGDVHAVGQLARVVTMIQVALDLVVIGAFVAVASSRVQALLSRHGTDPGPAAGAGV
jgi:voltage-gated potassium channel